MLYRGKRIVRLKRVVLDCKELKLHVLMFSSAAWFYSTYDLYLSPCATSKSRLHRMPFAGARKYSFNEMSEWFIPLYTRTERSDEEFWYGRVQSTSLGHLTMMSEKLPQFLPSTFTAKRFKLWRTLNNKTSWKLMPFPISLSFLSYSSASYKWSEELFYFSLRQLLVNVLLAVDGTGEEIRSVILIFTHN